MSLFRLATVAGATLAPGLAFGALRRQVLPIAVATLGRPLGQQRSALALGRRNFASEAVTQNAPKLGAKEVTTSPFAPLDTFRERHLGPKDKDVDYMLKQLGYSEVDQFIADAVPASIRLDPKTQGPDFMRPLSENELQRRGAEIAGQNKVFKSFIGMGYHNTHVPAVILRNVSSSSHFARVMLRC